MRLTDFFLRLVVRFRYLHCKFILISMTSTLHYTTVYHAAIVILLMSAWRSALHVSLFYLSSCTSFRTISLYLHSPRAIGHRGVRTLAISVEYPRASCRVWIQVRFQLLRGLGLREDHPVWYLGKDLSKSTQSRPCETGEATP